MKFFPTFSNTGLAVVYLAAFLCPVTRSCCFQSACSTDPCKSQRKVIYHQTMTPSWLEAHASYIDSSRSLTAAQLTFNASSTADSSALLKVRMIPAGVLKDSTPLTVEITVAHDVSIGQSSDSDTLYGVSDGIRMIGFETTDKNNYGKRSPCYGIEGTSGPTLRSIRRESLTPKPSDSFYPGQFIITLKLDERWGSCYTAHDGGFVRTAGYNNRLMPSKGLSLELYKDDKEEKVGIRFIKVSLIEDDA
ncbi:hypothetical protein AWC38_SpisGene8632 [Stylophora pistillata]|uniref:Uncharacterized protein n=2 Tax=Stylophora pistillata TaxID=50429 RepID=A0A2B4SCZ7_STYPI|nr:hypothetical protein AWC38_SpisGene8632 [Stylophora pistillata]